MHAVKYMQRCKYTGSCKLVPASNILVPAGFRQPLGPGFSKLARVSVCSVMAVVRSYGNVVYTAGRASCNSTVDEAAAVMWSWVL